MLLCYFIKLKKEKLKSFFKSNYLSQFSKGGVDVLDQFKRYKHNEIDGLVRTRINYPGLPLEGINSIRRLQTIVIGDLWYDWLTDND